jgi:predicted Zn-dependent protease
MEDLGQSEQRILEAAEGWLGLGSWKHAEAELEGIAHDRRGHREVLRVRWHVLAAQGAWVMAGQIARALCTTDPALPLGWVCLAHAAHRLNHTREARNLLLTIVDEFPNDYSIRYDLACYACLLGNIGEAWCWLERAMALPHSKKLDRMALQDPSLQSLWQAMLRKPVVQAEPQG